MQDLINALKLQERLQHTLDAGADLLKVILLYLITRAIIGRVGRVVVSRIERVQAAEAQKLRIRTLGVVVRNVVDYVLLVVILLMALRAVGIDITPLLATAGVAGLAIGFGAQRLVRDVVSGFFLLAENQFAVGEVVTIGAITGVVEEVGMRTTHLRDEQGRLVVIANGDVNLVINHSRRGGVRLRVSVKVAATADIGCVAGQLATIATEVGVEQPVVGVEAFDAASVTLAVSGEVPSHEREAYELRLKERLNQRLRELNVPLV